MHHNAFFTRLVVIAGIVCAPAAAVAQSGSIFAPNDQLRATIWVDPDGCEHWVMDDGLEGFMSQHLDRTGKPVCRVTGGRNGACRNLDSATVFASGSAVINPSARSELAEYFASIAGRTVIISGHTDSQGDDDFNLNLSLERAVAVAEIAGQNGVEAEARGFGEQVPIASNETAQGRALNRRVELTCS